MPIEEQHLFDPGATVTDPNKIDPVSIEGFTFGERLDVVEQTFAFIPDSPDELTRVLQVSSTEYGRRGAAAHLGEVARRQDRIERGLGYTTSLAVAHEMVGYFRSAMVEQTHLVDLVEDLAGINPDITVLEELTTRKSGAGMLANFVNRAQLLDLSRNTSATFASEDLSVDLTNRRDEPRVQAAIREALSQLSVREARELAQAAAVNHATRRDFWRARLVELDTFYKPVKHVVGRALNGS